MMAMNVLAFLAARNATEGLPSDKRNLFSILAAQSGTGIQGAVPAIALGKSEVATAKANETISKLSVAEIEIEKKKVETATMATATQELWKGIGRSLEEASTSDNGEVNIHQLVKMGTALTEKVRDQIDTLGLQPVKFKDTEFLGGAPLPGIQADPVLLDKSFLDLSLAELIKLGVVPSRFTD